MSVVKPFFDARPRPDEIDELKATFDRVLASGRYILGPEVEAFEAEVGHYLDTPYAIGVSSGTDALLMAMMAIDVGPGDEIIVPAFCFIAPAECVVRLGAKPIFYDCLSSFNANPVDVIAKCGPKTKAIVLAHLFGESCDMAEILAYAAQRGIAVIEDAAQSFGATYSGKQVGTLGLMGCYSFYPTKNLAALGDGGLVVTRDPHLAARLRRIRSHGAAERYEHIEIGGNFRLDALQAAFLRVRLQKLPLRLLERQRAAEHWSQQLRERGWVLPAETVERRTWNQYVVRVPAEQRAGIRAEFLAAGVATEVYYPKSLCNEAEAVRSWRYAGEVIGLPLMNGP